MKPGGPRRASGVGFKLGSVITAAVIITACSIFLIHDRFPSISLGTARVGTAVSEQTGQDCVQLRHSGFRRSPGSGRGRAYGGRALARGLLVGARFTNSDDFSEFAVR